MNTKNGRAFVSIVVPMFNESENIGMLYERLTAVLEKLDRPYEVICVNDGSKDNTLQLMIKINQKDPRFKIIDLSRNFGKEIALSAGLDYSNGEVVVPIDADLQDPPELICEMLERWAEGYDVVYAVRTQRDGESLLKKSTAALFYKIIGKLSTIDIPRNTGDFRLMSRQVVESLKELRETHRFMKGLFSWIGFRQTAIMYRRDARYAGKTKWKFGKLWNLALEGITSFSYLPLQWSMYFGFFVASSAFLYGLYLTIRTLIYGNPVPGYPSLMVIVLFLGGVQLFTVGIIGEYIGRIYTESKRRPLYVVRESIGFNEE